MLDRELTVERGLSEIGEIIQESHITISSDSPAVQALKAARLRHDELFEARKVYTHTGLSGGIKAKIQTTTEDEQWNLDRELHQLGLAVHKGVCKILWDSVDRGNDNVALQFIDPFSEAVQNAIEHGTAFCTKGNIEVHCTTGSEGILAVISQPTRGLSPEKIEEVIACKDTGELIYQPRQDEIRGMGLACYHNPDNAQIWFEFSNKDSPEFKVIILQTRKHLGEI